MFLDQVKFFNPITLIHRIRICGFLGDLLYGIPMLDNFSIFIKSEKIHGHKLIIARPSLMGMQGYQISICYCSDKLYRLIRILKFHSLKVVHKASCSVCHSGIMLNVFCSYIALDCFFWIALVGHAIEGYGSFLMLI